MKEIIVRTNFNKKTGLGHINRCKILGQYFEQKKYKTTFVIDNNIKTKFVKNLKIINLGEKIFNAKEDADKVLKIIKNKKIKFILVDDYRIDRSWEEIFFNKGYKIVILDDLANRKHVCNYIIDSGWYGREGNYLRYAKLLNKETKKLFGPEYKILNKRIHFTKNKDFNVLISFGGGNHITKYFSLIENIIERLSIINKRINLNIISSNFFKLRNFKSKKNVKVKLIKGNFELSNLISRTSLYVGSNSSIVNELTYLNIPRVLIAVNKFQNVNLKIYQELGNYIFLNFPNTKNQKKMAELVFHLIQNFRRIKRLFKHKKIKIPKNGAKKISEILLKDL